MLNNGLNNVKTSTRNLIKYAHNIGFFHLVSANTLILIAGFGMQILLARILSKQEIGIIAVLQSFNRVFLLIAQLGISTAIIKLCSEKIDADTQERIMINGFKMNIITSTVMVMLVMILAGLGLFSSDNRTINHAMQIYILHLPFVVFNYVIFGYLMANNQVKKYSRYQILIKSFQIVSLIVLSLFFSLKGYVIGVIIANGIGFGLLLKTSNIRWAQFKRHKLNKQIIIKIIDFSKYAFIANVVYQLVLEIGIIMANYYSGDKKEIAVYSMAVVMVNGIIMIPATYNQIMVPKISNTSLDLKATYQITKTIRRRMFGLVVVLFIGANLVLPFLIPILLGAKYSGTVFYFQILSIGLLTWGIHSPIANVLLSIGKMKLNLVTNTTVLVVQIIINAILLPQIGIVALAIAFVGSNFVAAVVSSIMLRIAFRQVIE